MFALIKKEVRSFLGSLLGYLVIITFLVLLSLFLWVFPGDFNILDAGYAGLDNLFLIAPWVYLFLIPAVTMRSFAEEKRTGTMELLFTKPISDFQIVTAKWLGGVVLVILSLTPTLMVWYSVHVLGSPAGNLDTGGTLGSYIGLLFLSLAFVSIGVFASACSSNQVVAFILSLFLCFFTYMGFEALSDIPFFSGADNIISQLGIHYHYKSMSRGVIDTRDLVYFAGLTFLFLSATKTVLESRKW
jgi:ABC-2 type transport system permease protein